MRGYLCASPFGVNGPHNEVGYKDLISKFSGEHFDPDEWASLFRRAGAQFVVPVAEHHDGLAMYDTAYSRWNTMKVGPHATWSENWLLPSVASGWSSAFPATARNTGGSSMEE